MKDLIKYKTNEKFIKKLRKINADKENKKYHTGKEIIYNGSNLRVTDKISNQPYEA